MTSHELCLRAGISAAQLSDIERGVKTLSIRRAKQIAVVLQLSLPELVARLLQDRLDDAGVPELRVSVSEISADEQNA